MLPAPFIIAAKRYWKPVLGGVVVIAGVWAFLSWRDNLVEKAEARGFARAEEQYQIAVTAANKVVEADNKSMDLMAMMFGGLASQRAQAIDLKVAPTIERTQSEVASDPRYRDCVISQRMFDDLNAARAAVNADISASNPRIDRRGSSADAAAAQ